jgi:hypothetical protein
LIALNEFEKKIQSTLNLDEKSTRRMDRVIADLTQEVGMEKLEILEFLSYGASTELSELELNYDWIKFYRKILKKLRPS